MGFFSFIKSQSFNYIVGIIGVLGVIYSIYASESAKQYGLIRFKSAVETIYNPVEINGVDDIVDGSRFKDLGPIYLSEITLWNAGNNPFEQKDLRSPVEVIGDQSLKILSYSIMNSKSASIDNFRLNMGENGRIEIKWNVFDPDDAIKIALLHSGDPSSISISGKFSPNHTISAVEKWRFFPVLYILFGVVVFLIYSQTLGAFIDDKVSHLRVILYFPCFLLNGILGGLIALSVIFILSLSTLYYFGEISPINEKFERRVLVRK